MRHLSSIPRRLLVVLLGWSALCVLCVPGCSSRDKTAESAAASTADDGTPREGGRLVIGVQQEPERLSEILNATATTNLVCNLIFSKFVKYDDEMNLIPDLITEIPSLQNGGISADFLAYTYHLRRDALWQDGEPVTSGDVRFTYEVIMDPRVNVESREGWDVIDRLETPDAYTAVFYLKRPYPDFVGETFYDESVLPAHVLRGETGKRFHISSYHHHPLGSGPFKVREWVRGSHIELVKNERYYGEGPYLDEIILKFVPDENTLLVQLKTGEIDLFDNIGAGFVDQAAAIDNAKMYSTPTLMYEHLDFNTENEILSDKRVRQAIAFATDKGVVAEQVYRGLAEVASLDEHPSSRYFDPEAAQETYYDPVRARRLLRDAGWRDGDGDGIREKDGRDLVLTISATAGNPNRERTELVLKEQFSEVGIELRIKNLNATVLYGSYEDGGTLKRGDFDIAMYAWLSSPEPASKEALYGSDNVPPAGQNHPRFRNAELSRLLSQGAKEVDPEERVRIYRAAARILVEEVPVVPLFWYTAVDVCTRDLRNFKPNPTQSADTWNAATWYLADRAGPRP
ncbi:MAG: peptide ABC transporter substrate-binding protein [Candidatus Krumholzibacteriia bacterium]